MTATIGGISVFVEDDSARFQQSMAKNAALVEQQTARMSRSLGGTAKSVDDLNRKATSFSPDPFRSMALSALRAQNSVERLQRTILALAAAGGGGFAGTFALKAVTDMADRYTTIQNKIAAVVSDSRERASVEQQIFDISQRTRLGYETTASLYQRLVLSAQNLNASQTQILQVVETTQKALLVGGATQSEAASVATQLSQALGSGRLQGDELRSILENSTVLAQSLAKEFGVSVGELKQMGSEGNLVASRVFKAILNAGRDIDEAFGQMAPTVAQSLQVLDNAFTRYIGQVDKSLGASSAMANGIIALSNNLESLGRAALYAAPLLGAIFAQRTGARLGGAIAAPFREASAAAGLRKEAAEAAAKEAQRIQAEAAINKKNADYFAREFANQPVFKQAAPATQTAFSRATAGLDKAQEAAAAATQKHVDLIQKRVDLEGQVGQVAGAADKAVERSRTVLAAREQRLNELIAQRPALEEAAAKAGGEVSRSQQQQFYNALGQEVAAREKLATARRQRLDFRDELRAAQAHAVDVAGTQQEAGALARVAEINQHLTAIEQNRTKALTDLYHADQRQQALNAQLNEAQASDRARAASKLNVLDAQIARGAQSVAEARENEARRTVAALESIQRANEKRAADLARTDTQIIAARQARDRQLGAVVEAQRGVQVATGAVTASAAERGGALAQDRLRASVQEGEAAAATARAQKTLQEAMRSTSNTAIVAAGAMTALRTVGGSLIAFLGGPWGVAFTAATVGLGLFEIAQARANARTAEFNDAAKSAGSAADELAKGYSKMAEAAANASLRIIEKGFPEQLENLRESIKKHVTETQLDPELFLPAAPPEGRVSATFRPLLEKFDEIQKDGNVTKATIDALIAELDRLGAANPDLSVAIQEIRKLADALAEAAGNASKLRLARDLAASQAGDFDTPAEAAERRRRPALTGSELPTEDREATRKIIEEERARRAETTKLSVKRERELLEEELDAAAARSENRADKVQRRFEKLKDQFPDTNQDRLRALAEAQEPLEKKKKQAKSDEQKAEERIADKIARIKEEAAAAFFTEQDRQAIEELTKLKGGAPLAAKAREALAAGTTPPEEFTQLRAALATKAAAKEYQGIVEKYGDIKQITPLVAAEQEKLNILLQMGKIDAVQYGEALADYLGKFQQYKWIDQLADSVKGFGDSIADAFYDGKLNAETFGKAIDDLGKQLFKLALNEAVLTPIRNMLRGGLATAFAPGGGGLGSLFGGGGGAAAVPGLYHAGGMVGFPRETRAVPAGLFLDAPHYAGGLRPGEFAAILHQGESVLTGRQTEGVGAMAGALAGMKGGYNVTINEAPGTQAQVSQGHDGGLHIDIMQLAEAGLADRVGRGQGSLAKAVRANATRGNLRG
jgi:tape measure domain-containing protein